jgi:hypothetical protein
LSTRTEADADDHSAKRLRPEHSRATGASDRHRSSNGTRTSGFATMDRRGNGVSEASGGRHGPSASNAARTFQSILIDEEDEDRAGPSTASVPCQPAPRVLNTPTPPASQIALTPLEKVQRIETVGL